MPVLSLQWHTLVFLNYEILSVSMLGTLSWNFKIVFTHSFIKHVFSDYVGKIDRAAGTVLRRGVRAARLLLLRRLQTLRDFPAPRWNVGLLAFPGKPSPSKTKWTPRRLALCAPHNLGRSREKNKIRSCGRISIWPWEKGERYPLSSLRGMGNHF